MLLQPIIMIAIFLLLPLLKTSDPEIEARRLKLELTRNRLCGTLARSGTVNALDSLIAASHVLNSQAGSACSATFNVGSFPYLLLRLFLRRPVGVPCDMLPILLPARRFDPST